MYLFSQSMNRQYILFFTVLVITFMGNARSEEIGSVDTKFNLLSPDDSIKIQVVTDPKVKGVVCYLSRAQKGGYRGALGIAEDTSDASIDCRQVGAIEFLQPFSKGESVFRERRSLIFKKLKVVRFCDTNNNTLVYLAYSERVIEGSPKNSVSAVPISKWHTQSHADEIEQCKYK